MSNKKIYHLNRKMTNVRQDQHRLDEVKEQIPERQARGQQIEMFLK